MLEVAIFDDIVYARGEAFKIPGLRVDVFPDADDVVGICDAHPYAVIFMDYAMGEEHLNGGVAVRKLRANGFTGRIVAISSDPVANAEMRGVGADESLAQKAHLRSYLVHLGAEHLKAPKDASDGDADAPGTDAPGTDAPGTDAPDADSPDDGPS